MKNIFVIILLTSFVINGFSQRNTFIRVFNASGSKIAKGQLNRTTDSSLILTKGKIEYEIKYNNIKFIKTRHSIGHNILLTSTILSGTLMLGGLLGNSTSSGLEFYFDLSTTDIIVLSLLLGAIDGVIIGGITGGLQKRDTYSVSGDYEKWQKVRLELDNWPVVRTR